MATTTREGELRTVTMDADLVLEGGGVKGIGLVGAANVLMERGYTFRRIAGTSAGAIVAALIAADVPPRRLRQLIEEQDYTLFRDEGLLDRLGLAGKGLSLLLEKGIYEGDYLRNDVAALLKERGVRTFGDLRVED